MIALLDTLGEASVSAFWIPAAVWTVVAVAADAGLGRWGGRAPATAYRLAQAALFALPLGLAVSLLVSPEWLASFKPEVVLTVAPASGPDVPVAVLPIETVGVPAITLGLVSGVALLLVVVTGVLGLVRLGVQAVRLGRLRRALPEADSSAVRDEVAIAAADAGLRTAPRVLVTTADVVPMTLGVWRPLVVLPDRLGDDERHLALAHEIEHVRRADPLAHTVEAVTSALFALHPLAARLARRCDLYREMACDAAVLARAGADRRSYAALVSSFATSGRVSPSPVALGMAARLPHVHQRLLAMKHLAPSRTSRLAGPLALAVLASGILLMTVGRAAAQPARVVVVEGPGNASVVVERTAPAGVVVESALEAVVFVDGERIEGSLSDTGLEPDEIYSVDVRKGDDVRAEYGVESVIRVTTRAGAAAAGLPDEPDVAGTVSGSPSIAFRAQVSEADGADPDSVTVSVYARDGEGRFVARLREGGGVVVEQSRECETSVDAPCAASEVHVTEDGPLVFVDGVRVETPDVAPDDIASVEVIKGEGALAYGAAAEQGVIRITTKSAARRAALTEAEAATASGLSVVASPNPADDEVEFILSIPEAEVFGVEVYDVRGRLVYEHRHSLAVDASDLPAGAYVARVTARVDGVLQTSTVQFSIGR